MWNKQHIEPTLYKTCTKTETNIPLHFNISPKKITNININFCFISIWNILFDLYILKSGSWNIIILFWIRVCGFFLFNNVEQSSWAANVMTLFLYLFSFKFSFSIYLTIAKSQPMIEDLKIQIRTNSQHIEHFDKRS